MVGNIINSPGTSK
ncbi:unnamed protein product [Cuscuta epithymum]|nr:unnamed protein product [Cuscuta epithymum]